MVLIERNKSSKMKESVLSNEKPNFNATEKAEVAKVEKLETLPCTPSELVYSALTKGGGPWVCVGMLGFGSQPDANHVRDTVVGRLLEIPRFHSRFVRNDYGGHFQRLSKEELNINDGGYHWRVALDDNPEGKPATQQQVDDLLGAIHKNGMDMSKPLWYLTFIPQLESGGSLLIAAIDHTVGDGAALVQTLLSLADKTEKSPAVDSKMLASRRPPPEMGWFARVRMIIWGTFNALGNTIRAGDPRSVIGLAIPDQATPHKAVARTSPIEMKRIMIVKSHFKGATINDIFASVLSMTINACLKEKGDSLFGTNKLSAAFPVDIRPREQESKFKDGSPYNASSVGKLDLVLKYEDPIDCVNQTMAKMLVFKQNPAPVVMLQMFEALFVYMSLESVKKLFLTVLTKASVYLSNVQGPRKRITVAGSELESLSFYVFTALGFYIGLISYDGKMSANVVMDASIETKPADVCRHWGEQFELLEAAVANAGTEEK